MKIFRNTVAVVVALGVVMLYMVSCNKSEFSAGTPIKGLDAVDEMPDAKPQDTGTIPQDPPAPGEPSPCVVGDKVDFKFPSDIQACIDNNRIWNFVTSTCTDIVGDPDLRTFDGFKDAVGKLIGSDRTAAIATAKERGGLFISCGSKKAGKTLVAQWYFPGEVSINEETCEFDQKNAMVVNACYKQYDGQQPAAPTTAEEKSARVQECLNE